MKRNFKAWYYIVSAALVICLVFTFSFYNRITELETALENGYQSSFSEFVTSSEQLAALCTKAGVVNSPMQRMSLMSQINFTAMNAENALSELPFAQEYVSEMSTYINQLGDYAQYCLDTLSHGDDLSPMQIEQLHSFAQDMENTAISLEELQDVEYNDGMRFMDMNNMGRYLDIENVEQNDYDIAFVFTELNRYFAEKEDLDYDGRFSTHMQNVAAVGLSGDKIERETAAIAANSFLQVLGREIRADALRYGSESDESATMPAFFFQISDTDGNSFISVSKQGGKILDYYYDRVITGENISIEQAREAAEDIVAAAGYEAMEVMAQYRSGSSICFEFGFRDSNSIMYYPDKVLIEIALDNGEAVAFEAHEYYMYHTERTLGEPTVLREVAEAGLNSELEVEESGMALISDGKGNEVLCYEFRVKNGDDSYIMHISGDDGSEQQILQYITNEDGFYTK